MRNTAAHDGRPHQCSTTGEGGLATAAATYSWDNDEDKAVNSCTIQSQRPMLAHVEMARLVLAWTLGGAGGGGKAGRVS